MRESFKSVAAVAAGVLAMSSMASAAYISQDFEADTVGSPPSGTNYISGNVQVVDSASDPADPFGPAGNQSMLVQDDADPSAAQMSFPGAAGGIQQGTFTSLFRVVDESPWVTKYFEFKVGKNTLGSGDLGIWFAVNGSGGISNYGAGGPIDNTVTFNANHTMVINFDAGTDTWSGTLDGDPITGSGGTVTSFGFMDAQPYIQSVGYNSGYSSTTTVRAFVDNISVVEVPEPASMGLILGAGAMMLRRRVR